MKHLRPLNHNARILRYPLPQLCAKKYFLPLISKRCLHSPPPAGAWCVMFWCPGSDCPQSTILPPGNDNIYNIYPPLEYSGCSTNIYPYHRCPDVSQPAWAINLIKSGTNVTRWLSLPRRPHPLYMLYCCTTPWLIGISRNIINMDNLGSSCWLARESVIF